MTSTGRYSLAAIACTLLWAGVAQAHDLVSGDMANVPLPPTAIATIDGADYVPLDVSASGRYVLFANYSEAAVNPGFPALPNDKCKIYRKDRSTGELLRVFKSEASVRYYCNGARMSADGNIVAAPPAAPPSNPAGEVVEVNGNFVVSYGNVVALTVKDIDSGTSIDITTPLLSNSANRITEIDLFGVFSGYDMDDLSADGNVALISTVQVTGNTVSPVPSLVDIDQQTVSKDFLRDDADNIVSAPSGISLSADGQTVAFSTSVEVGAIPPCVPQPPFGCVPALRDVEDRVYLLDRETDSVTELEDLRNTRAPMPGFFANPRIVRPDSLSAGGGIVSLIESPPWCETGGFGIDLDNDGNYDPVVVGPCGPGGAPCVGAECRFTITRYEISTREFDVEQTVIGELTRHAPVTHAQFSRDSNRLLYARTVINPFGGDFEIPNDTGLPADYICVSRASVDSGGVPVVETCVPSEPGPIRPCELIDPTTCGPLLPSALTFTDFRSPVLWYLRNLNTGNEELVSIHDGNIFQANAAVLSDDGRTVAYQTREPRLRDDMLTNNSLDESMLPDACFWPNGPGELNLRVITNDNARFFTAPTQYVYEFMPVFCPAPSPALEGQIFANDVLPRPRFIQISRSSSSFGFVLLPLLGLLVLSRRFRTGAEPTTRR